MSKKLKITKEELTSVNEAISKSNQAKAILGDATTRAYVAQLQVMEVEKELSEVQEDLKEKYGSITLDVKTGEYTESKE